MQIIINTTSYYELKRDCILVVRVYFSIMLTAFVLFFTSCGENNRSHNANTRGIGKFAGIGERAGSSSSYEEYCEKSTSDNPWRLLQAAYDYLDYFESTISRIIENPEYCEYVEDEVNSRLNEYEEVFSQIEKSYEEGKIPDEDMAALFARIYEVSSVITDSPENFTVTLFQNYFKRKI